MGIVTLLCSILISVLLIYFCVVKNKSAGLDSLYCNEQGESKNAFSIKGIGKKMKTATGAIYVLGAFIMVFCICFRVSFRDYANNIIGFTSSWGDSALTGQWLLSAPLYNFIVTLLRAFTQLGVLLLIVFPFFNIKSINLIVSYFLPAVYLLDMAFFKGIMFAMTGGEGGNLYALREILFSVEVAVGFVLSAMTFAVKIKTGKTKSTLKQALIVVLVCFSLTVAVMPLSTVQNLFGLNETEAKGLNYLHRIMIYFVFSLAVVIYFSLRHKDYVIRDFTLSTLSICGFITYFDVRYLPMGWTNLPLQLCNTAILLMLISFICKSKKLFYFNYFVNVVGAFAAFTMPNTSDVLFAADSLKFWYNHAYAVILPILAVALKIFPRPNLKMIWNSIWVFTIYFVCIALLNSYLTNWYPSVDYFFLNSDFLIDKFTFARPLKYDHLYYINLREGITLRISWLYWLAIYCVYVGLMFVEWLIYAYLYKVSDDHYILLTKKRKERMDMLGIKKLMNGRTASEPLEKENANKICIRHFTKVYGNSKVKSVDDFSLEINGGEVYGFLGHNGAGKSTTIKSLVGIQTITSGQMVVCGYDVEKQPLEAKMNIGYVSDNHAVYENLTGREYIDYVANLYLVSKEDRVERLKRYSERFQLIDALDREIKSYSHGMKQKLVVIASLIHEPRVWILDEPLTGLDPTSCFQIKECMREHANKGNIVFFSSHVIEVVEKICDKICIIGHGKLIGEYRLSELKQQGVSLEELYMKYVQQNDASMVKDQKSL